MEGHQRYLLQASLKLKEINYENRTHRVIGWVGRDAANSKMDKLLSAARTQGLTLPKY